MCVTVLGRAVIVIRTVKRQYVRTVIRLLRKILIITLGMEDLEEEPVTVAEGIGNENGDVANGS